MIQIRERNKSEEEVERIVAEIVDAIGDAHRVSVNSFPDIAARWGTNLHLPGSVPSPRSDLVMARGAFLSRSIHHTVESTDADYLILGNLMETTSKVGKSGIGLAAFREIAATCPAPVLAIGGVEPKYVKGVLEHGGYGVAVRSYVIGAPNPERAAREFRTQIDKWSS